MQTQAQAVVHKLGKGPTVTQFMAQALETDINSESTHGTGVQNATPIWHVKPCITQINLFALSGRTHGLMAGPERLQ
jgi:hypothetical protein